MAAQYKRLKMLSTTKITAFLKNNGVDIVGFHLIDNDYADYYQHLEQKKAAGSLYERTNMDASAYIAFNEVVPHAKTIISLGICYSQPVVKVRAAACGCYSQISYGQDYHLVLTEKLKLLQAYILKTAGIANCYFCCDTGVLDDRYVAYLCGNGFYGKNSMLINEEFGPSVVYGSFVCDIAITDIINKKLVSQCGCCNLCEQACPTKSLHDYQLHYATCLAYLTQSKAMIPAAYLKDCFYGCDICNNICPYQNKLRVNPLFKDEGYDDLLKIIMMSKKEYEQSFACKSMSWLNYNIIKKNALLLYVKRKHLKSDEIVELRASLLKKKKLNSNLMVAAFNYLLEGNDD